MSRKFSTNSNPSQRNTSLTRLLMIGIPIAGVLGILIAGILFSPGLDSVEATTNSSYPVSEDQDQDNIPNWIDLDDDNDGIPDAVECGNVPVGPYTTSQVTFHTTDNGSSVPATLDSLVADGTTFKTFLWPDSYTTNATTTAMSQMYERLNGGVTGLDKHTSANYETDILPCFRNNNLRNYQSWDGQAVYGASYFELCYNTPINTYDVPLLMFQERLGNNSWEVEVFDENGNMLNPGGTSVFISNSTYVNTGITIDFGQDAFLVMRPITDFAPLGTEISCIRMYAGSGNNGDAGDGKVYVVYPEIANFACADTDGDGLADHLDLDSDNDGIPDIIEAGGADTDGNGMVDDVTDTDGDGLADLYDNDDTDGPDGSSPCSPQNSCLTTNSTSALFDTNADGTNDEDGDLDGDGIPNFLDLDADNDGILDIVEAGLAASDADGDGIIDDALTNDSDGNGWSNTTDGGNGGTTPVVTTDSDNDGFPDSYDTVNQDGDANPNFLDIDADNDGIVDNTEGQPTVGYIAPSGSDTDDDGIDDAYDIDCQPCGAITGTAIVPINSGGANEPDYLDTDSDGDGKPDSLEGHDTNADGVIDGSDSPIANTGLPGGTTDSDGDGLLDGYDNDNADPDPTNGNLNPSSHPDEEGITAERDWREDLSLPVEWLSFDATLNGSHAQLNWTTAAELNSDFYQIERSTDGLLFESIGQVQAAGTTSEESDYQFQDTGIGTSQYSTILYRIRQVDFNGTFDYSNTVQLEIISSDISHRLNIYPNPARETLMLEATYPEQAVITITNAIGQVVFSKTLESAQNTEEFRIIVSGWPSGVYHASLSSPQQKIHQKIVIQ